MNSKLQTYQEIVPQVASIIEGVGNRTGALANVSSLLKGAFSHYFWVGFYIVNGDALELGPFQGDPACYSIGKGKGVCGTAWAEGQSVTVPDVHKFPGHIACSSKSCSEIVVPIMKGDEVKAVIDVDSESYGSFDDTDREGLERIAVILSALF